MEITKQNCTFTISDTTELGWIVSGSASKDVSGAFNINFSIIKPGELTEDIGSGAYNKPAEATRVDVNYNVLEEYKSAFVTYMETLIKSVTEYFNTSSNN